MLEKYRQKRNFKSTPEPAGDLTLAASRARATQPGKARFFCVQKHLATQLHYDFRLEHDGVLLSWAVPKGPALDPKIKRLAMHVEDHPLEYGEFEGVIPEGYGAGIVMLWDVGTWKPLTDDVGAALRKGDLKFELDGYKLKGSWVLVRTGGRYGSSRPGAAQSWLLIKHRDDWAGELDIAEFAPNSVKSGGDFVDILAAGDPDIWRSNRPGRAGEAADMLAKIVEKAVALKAEQAAKSTKKERSARHAVTETPAASPRKRASSRAAARKKPAARAKGKAATRR